MTDRELMQQALEAMGTVGADWICEASHHAKKDQHKWGEPCPLQQRWHIAYQAVRERLAQPQRTHWEGCEEVHPECRQPEQEPVAWLVQYSNKHEFVWGQKPQWIADAIGIEPLYTTPQRQPLTDEEIRLIAWGDFGVDQKKHLAEVLPLARAIEAAHGIKGQA